MRLPLRELEEEDGDLKAEIVSHAIYIHAYKVT
jgi:hypothetical protein